MAEESAEKKDMETEVEDNDADARDVERTESKGYEMVLEELKMIRAENAAIKAQINSMQGQRAITIESGAVIQDDTEPTGTDNFVPYDELDFTVR